MLIDLEEPFKSLWLRGNLYISKENRRTLSLSGLNNSFTITYARYLMCVKLGYILPTELEVDHIDYDKTNDDISNLQVLTKQENLLKEHYRYIMEEQKCYGFICAYCETNFILTERKVNMRLAQNVELAFCSRPCAQKYYITTSGNNFSKPEISNENKLAIKELHASGLSSYKISETTGFARNTVMKYW